MTHCRQKLSGNRCCSRNNSENTSFCWQHLIGGRDYYHPKTKRQYSGAGILLIEDDHVLLFHDEYKDEYEDLGGGYEKKHGNLLTTARVEAQEESANLININNHNVLQTFLEREPQPRSRPGRYFRLYLLKVSGFDDAKFYENYDIIDQNQKRFGEQKGWLEMDKLTRVPIAELYHKTATDKVRNVNGKLIQLSGRCRMFLDNLGLQEIEKISRSKKSVKLGKAKRYRNKNSFLNRTWIYLI